MERYDEAVAEFEYVRKAAPDNLTATRELADIEQRRRAASGEARAPEVPNAPPAPAPVSVPEPVPELAVDPVIAELEAWLAVFAEERVTRAARI